MRRKLAILSATCAALFALGGVAAGSASAAQWLLNGNPTASPVATEGSGTLKLTDEAGGPFGESVTVECSGTTTGTAGAGVADVTSTVTVSGCNTIEGTCGSPAASAVDLSWQTELFEPSAGLVRDHIRTNGNGEPGYKVECTVFGIRATDTCKSNSGQPLVEKAKSPVPVIFDKESGTATCSRGGAGKGHVRGTVLISSKAGVLSVG